MKSGPLRSFPLKNEEMGQIFHNHAKVSQKGAKYTREVKKEVGIYAVKKKFYFFHFSFFIIIFFKRKGRCGLKVWLAGCGLCDEMEEMDGGLRIWRFANWLLVV